MITMSCLQTTGTHPLTPFGHFSKLPLSLLSPSLCPSPSSLPSSLFVLLSHSNFTIFLFVHNRLGEQIFSLRALGLHDGGMCCRSLFFYHRLSYVVSSVPKRSYHCTPHMPLNCHTGAHIPRLFFPSHECFCLSDRCHVLRSLTDSLTICFVCLLNIAVKAVTMKEGLRQGEISMKFQFKFFRTPQNVRLVDQLNSGINLYVYS